MDNTKVSEFDKKIDEATKLVDGRNIDILVNK